MKHIFGTVGLPGSGKSTLANIAEEEFSSVITTSMGDIVRRLASREGYTTSSEIGQFATRMREEHGQGIFAERLIDELDSPDDSILVIDGIRSPEEITKLRESTETTCTIVYIKASRDTRYNRVVNRGREDEDQMSFEEFVERDNREIGWGFDTIIEEEYYDTVIENEDSFEEFRSAIKSTLHEKL